MIVLVARCFNCCWGTEPEDADLVLDQSLDHSSGPCGGPVLVLSPAKPIAAEVRCRNESFSLAKVKDSDTKGDEIEEGPSGCTPSTKHPGRCAECGEPMATKEED